MVTRVVVRGKARTVDAIAVISVRLSSILELKALWSQHTTGDRLDITQLRTQKIGSLNIAGSCGER